MAMSRTTAVGSIVTGSVMLCFTLVTVICGGITLHILPPSVHAAVSSVGLWSLYVSFIFYSLCAVLDYNKGKGSFDHTFRLIWL